MPEGATEYKQYLREDLPSEDVVKKKNRRALILFLILVLIGGICILAYFMSGRGWSIAATILDDTVGNMKSYTAVVFSGVGEREIDLDTEERALFISDSSVISSSVKNSATVGLSDNNDAFVQGPLNAEFNSDDEASDNANDISKSSDLSGGLIKFDESGEIEYDNLGDQIMSAFYRAMAKFKTEDQNQVYVSDVSDLYQSAGAQVATINISDIDYYLNPVIYSAGDKKVGVFSISSYVSKSKLSKIIDDIKSNGADIVICIAPRTAMVSNFKDIDALIVTSQDFNSNDEDKGATLLIEAPYAGEVGIILFSQNNAAYYKSIDEL